MTARTAPPGVCAERHPGIAGVLCTRSPGHAGGHLDEATGRYWQAGEPVAVAVPDEQGAALADHEHYWDEEGDCFRCSANYFDTAREG